MAKETVDMTESLSARLDRLRQILPEHTTSATIPTNERSNIYSYRDSFYNEGDRKASFITEHLNYLKEHGYCNPRRILVVSIGGADGSDLIRVHKDTDVCYSILVEFDEENCERARQKRKNELKKEDRMIVLPGDVGHRINEVHQHLTDFQDRNEVDGIAFIFLGILHEIPSRSNLDLRHFLQNISFWTFPTLIFLREPCLPINWPEYVYVRIYPDCEEEVKPEKLMNFAKYVHTQCWKKNSSCPPPAPTLAGPYVCLKRDLAAETLFKCLREDTNFQHVVELEETLTEFQLETIKKAIMTSCNESSVVREQPSMRETYDTSGGFKTQYRKYGVKVVDGHGAPLEMPQNQVTFICDIGISQSNSDETDEQSEARTNQSISGYDRPQRNVMEPPTLAFDENLRINMSHDELCASLAELRYRVANDMEPYFYVDHEGLNRANQLAEEINNKDSISEKDRVYSVRLKEYSKTVEGELERVKNNMVFVFSGGLYWSEVAALFFRTDPESLSRFAKALKGAFDNHNRVFKMNDEADVDVDIYLDQTGRLVARAAVEKDEAIKATASQSWHNAKMALSIPFFVCVSDFPVELREEVFYPAVLREVILRRSGERDIPEEMRMIENWWVGLH